MSRAGAKITPNLGGEIPLKPEAVVAYEQQQKEFRVQRLYEQCKFRALGLPLFTDIPQVKGVLLANFMLDVAMQQIMIAQAGIVAPPPRVITP